jgi:hypothetical protein
VDSVNKWEDGVKGILARGVAPSISSIEDKLEIRRGQIPAKFVPCSAPPRILALSEHQLWQHQ